MTAIYVEENSITIDGDLEEAVWNLAEPVAGGLGTGFYAQSPVRSELWSKVGYESLRGGVS